MELETKKHAFVFEILSQGHKLVVKGWLSRCVLFGPHKRVFFLIEPIILKYDDFMFLSTSLAFL